MSKEAFYKGQRTSEREHQSVVWLHAGMDDQDKSIIIWCVVCRKYETRMCGLNFWKAWTFLGLIDFSIKTHWKAMYVMSCLWCCVRGYHVMGSSNCESVLEKAIQ